MLCSKCSTNLTADNARALSNFVHKKQKKDKKRKQKKRKSGGGVGDL